MTVRLGHVAFTSAIVICLGHILFLPTIFFFGGLLITAEKIDIALIVGPITAAYFTTIVRFALDNKHRDLLNDTKEVNALFIFIAAVVVLPFIIGLYIIIILYNTGAIVEATTVKQLIGLVEIWFGATFALFVDTVFGKQEGE